MFIVADFYGECAVKILFESKSVCGNFEKDCGTRKNSAAEIENSVGKSGEKFFVLIEIKITENADKKIEFTAEKNWKGEIKIVRTINRNGRFLHIDTIATVESGEMKIKVENGTDIYGNKKFSMKNYKTEKKINESLSILARAFHKLVKTIDF